MVKAGIYIHIPFCKTKCFYCDFYSVAGRDEVIPRFIKALLKEIESYELNKNWIFDTLFIGGGTPSLMQPGQIESILKILQNKFDISQIKEITIEANPGEAPLNKLMDFKSLGINRLSIGTQSLNRRLLEFLTRIHSPEDVFKTVKAARTAGFDNINCDLIFNIPVQSLNTWKTDLKSIIALDIEHLSCYSLTVEENTPLFQNVKQGKIIIPGEDQSADLYKWTQDKLQKTGYDQYEISNWSSPHRECAHNLHYWKIEPYLAFGPSAHGFDGQKRWFNYRNLDIYLKAVESGRSPKEHENKITPREFTNEIIGFGLRTKSGVNLDKIPHAMKKMVISSIRKGKLKWGKYFKEEGEKLSLTPSGFAFADAIAVDLML
ncbi:MAG: radical SAM family heme chaperone HemW [Candidatus Neomarinimicrobiota bacterium]